MTLVRVEGHGSLVLVRPVAAIARAWLEERALDALWVGGALVCEPRYVGDLLAGMTAELVETT